MEIMCYNNPKKHCTNLTLNNQEHFVIFSPLLLLKKKKKIVIRF